MKFSNRYTKSVLGTELKGLLQVRTLSANTTLPTIEWPRIPPPPAPPRASTHRVREPFISDTSTPMGSATAY
jgi:hypothetical protein